MSRPADRGASRPADRAAGEFAALPPDERPVPVGAGPAYRLPSLSARVADRAPVGRLRCGEGRGRSVAVHLELFARRRVLPVPAGIGVAPPRAVLGAYVRPRGCVYPLRTLEPTGVVLVPASPSATLGELFAIWGQSLSRTRLAGFRGRVLADLDGAPWPADPRAIPLRRHAQIVLEIGGSLPPHRRYLFPPGL